MTWKCQICGERAEVDKNGHCWACAVLVKSYPKGSTIEVHRDAEGKVTRAATICRK